MTEPISPPPPPLVPPLVPPPPPPPPPPALEWAYMDSLRPPVYICLRRKPSSDGKFHRMVIDGRVDKYEWSHVPWSEPFVDIEGVERKPTEYPLTRFKMMYDDSHVYIGAELVEPKIWGTLRQKNSTMYHENDFEVFLNPDGSRHHYYELELNCLNTIWELLLHKPYKDGYSITNPHNLSSLRSAVYVDGVTNAPLVECTKWCVEVALALPELVQFDALRGRALVPGDVWRVNFSRVQYALDTVMDSDTRELRYEKVPDRREDNIVWAPTGVIDIHRPEKWGVVFFSSQQELPGGESELASAMAEYLHEQLAIERVLDTVYYDQREFYKRHEGFASRWEQLYATPEAFSHADLLRQFALSTPTISCRSGLGGGDKDTSSSSRESSGGTPRRRRSYVPALDVDDDDASEGDAALALLSPRSREIRCKEARGVFATYTVTVRSATQQWSMAHDSRLWKSKWVAESGR